jgi:hypothetical protein
MDEIPASPAVYGIIEILSDILIIGSKEVYEVLCRQKHRRLLLAFDSEADLLWRLEVLG